MIWRLMDTYDLIKDIEEPFSSHTLRDKMLALGMDPEEYRNRYFVHLYKLTKQGFLTRTEVTQNRFKKPVYMYEVVRDE